MKKISAVLILIVAVAAGFLLFYLNPSKKRHEYTIAVLNYSPVAEPAIKGFLEGLQKYGYREGSDFRIVYSGFFKDKAKLNEEAAKLVSYNPDIIFTMTTIATIAAKKAVAGKGIPIIFGPVSTPVETGIVRNLRYPNNNVTGVAIGSQEAMRFEMLKQFSPGIKNILVPYSPDNKSPEVGISKLKELATELHVNITTLAIPSDDLLEKKLDGFKGNFDAIFIPTDPVIASKTRTIAQYAVAKKVIMSCPQREGVLEGALYSYGFSIKDIGTQAARIAHMVLSGTKPGDIPVEVSEFRLSLNLDTANKIGLNIPDFLMKNSFIIRR